MFYLIPNHPSVARIASQIRLAFPELSQSLEELNLRNASATISPKATVYEEDDSFRVVFQIPSDIEKGRLNISICGESVTLSDNGHKNDNGGKVLYDERPVLSTRSINLHKRIQDAGHSAKFDQDKRELTVIAKKSTGDSLSVQID